MKANIGVLADARNLDNETANYGYWPKRNCGITIIANCVACIFIPSVHGLPPSRVTLITSSQGNVPMLPRRDLYASAVTALPMAYHDLDLIPHPPTIRPECLLEEKIRAYTIADDVEAALDALFLAYKDLELTPYPPAKGIWLPCQRETRSAFAALHIVALRPRNDPVATSNQNTPGLAKERVSRYRLPMLQNVNVLLCP
jgi:hypothetical protein